MVASQYGIKYAVHIITNHFGDHVAKVCECLLRKGPLNLASIIQFTQLQDLLVKNSLLVLIQHNCLQAYALEQPGKFGTGPRLNTHYMVLFDNILHRARFPKFLKIVSEELDQQCFKVLEALLEHGRLTLKQMLDRAASKQKEGNEVNPEDIREVLLKLVSSRYVERCPASEPFIPLPTEEETAANNRRPKSSKIIVEKQTLEQRVLSEAMPMDGIRFSVITNSEPDSNEGIDENDTPSIVGMKRKHSAVDSNCDLGAIDEHVLWRANFEEFTRRLRHKACVEYVRGQLEDGASVVLNAMLEATRSEEKKLKAERSVPLSLNSVYEEVIKSEAGRNMTFDRVKACLVQLGSPSFVKEFDGSYSIDLKNIIELAISGEMESIVLKKYGRDAYRMLRLLSKADRLLDTVKIAETTFVQKKDAQAILYKMWQDEYLHMELLKVVLGKEIEFVLWKVNKDNFRQKMLDEIFHAALNLDQRVAFEVEQDKQISNLARDNRDGNPKDRLNRLKKVRILLLSSQIKLDDSIMLFHSF